MTPRSNKTMIANETMRVRTGDCASTIAYAACRFAAGCDGKRLKCGAPQALYNACHYSAHYNPIVPIFEEYIDV